MRCITPPLVLSRRIEYKQLCSKARGGRLFASKRPLRVGSASQRSIAGVTPLVAIAGSLHVLRGHPDSHNYRVHGSLDPGHCGSSYRCAQAWARSGRSRLAERELRKRGINLFWTPTDPGSHTFASGCVPAGRSTTKLLPCSHAIKRAPVTCLLLLRGQLSKSSLARRRYSCEAISVLGKWERLSSPQGP
jgi:hypothetical protein